DSQSSRRHQVLGSIDEIGSEAVRPGCGKRAIMLTIRNLYHDRRREHGVARSARPGRRGEDKAATTQSGYGYSTAGRAVARSQGGAIDMDDVEVWSRSTPAQRTANCPSVRTKIGSCKSS